MRTFSLLIIWLSFVSIRSVEPGSKSIFGVRISTEAGSQLTSFVALRYSTEGVLREKRIYSKDEFIKILSGFWPSPYNPKRVNLFEQNKVFGGVFVNDTIKQTVAYCPIFDSLWKIRFSDFPYNNGRGAGWSQNQFRPSLKQEKYLADRYNVKQLDFEYIVDTNFWNLLRDTSDSTWVMMYKNL